MTSAFRRSRFVILIVLLAALAFVLSIADVSGAAKTGSTLVRKSSAEELAASAFYGPGDPPGVDPALVQGLRQRAQGQVQISTRRSTGVASFVRAGRGGDLLPGDRSAIPQGKATGFFTRYGGLFGIRDANIELVDFGAFKDAQGAAHLSYQQVYNGVPVFGGILRAHLDAGNRLTAINGVFVPDVSINTIPALSAEQVAARAINEVRAKPAVGEDAAPLALPAGLSASAPVLYVYRDGLIQDVRGSDYLVYEVEVTGGAGLREFVYIDAHSGKVVNRISAVQDALFRRLFEQNTDTQVWQEGDPFPGDLNVDQQNIVNFSGDSYYYFFNAFGIDSYDNAGAEMQSVNNDPRISCPNANWNGATTNYCNGVTADDVVAHEWGHAYTQFTHNLIYQWQPGALNEAYSDIWGETVDMLNGAGTDAPSPVRSVDVCSIHTTPIPVLTINSPADIAGDYAAAGAAFGPPLTETGITGDVVLADDGAAPTSDACTPLVNGSAVSGNIALVDRGTCAFTVKVKNAQDAGAVAVIVANNTVGPPSPMGGADSTITIPSVMVAQSTGDLIKGELANGVNATMHLSGGGLAEDSYRWLMGEDATAFGGAIRDMWAPTCLADPGKVTDAQYHCAATDGGGVHTNSGVPNHGYALLVDGGTYNGQTITPIGLVKAAHIYWRAQDLYQTPSSNFSDHADALEAACSDLIGVPLEGLSTSTTPAGPSGEVISAADCAEVSDMIEAVEFNVDPTAQCNFQPLLKQGAPAFCSDTPDPVIPVDLEDFEAGLGEWTLTNQGVFTGWLELDWEQSTVLPGGRSGAAAFGADPDAGNCDLGAGDVSGVMRMESPPITIPTGNVWPRLAFDHYVATELGWDGGNLKISINGGPYNLVPPAAYTFNPYNQNLEPPPGNTNPLAGQPGFTGTDGGQVFGSWGQSQINLGALDVKPGDTIRLRYDMGMDGCTGIDGWYVDDVNVYACTNNPPTIALASGSQCTSDSRGRINLTIDDDLTPAGSLTLSATSSNSELVPVSNIVFGGSGANRTVTITPASRKSGRSTVTITVRDAGASTGSLTVEVVVGTNKDETLNGTSGADLIFGLNGIDIVNAGAGIDLVCGGNGNDTLNGDADNDSLWGQFGNDQLTGGTEADFFSGGPGTDTATDFNAGEGDTQDGSIP